jgi:tetratricopeptide (TPR) repeat protein
VKLLKYSHNRTPILLLVMYLVAFQSCYTSTKNDAIKLDFSKMQEDEKSKFIQKIQQQVDDKLPYQGSLLHQSRCDTLIALNYNLSGNYQEKSVPHTKIGDYHIAYPYLEKAYQSDPKDALYYYSWLMLYYYRDYERALTLLTEYDNYTPGSASYAWGENVNFLKGLAFRQLKQYNDAIKEFTQYITDEGDRTDIYTYVYRGICYCYNNDHNLAIDDFDYVIKQYANCSAAYFWKAEVLIQKKQYADALNNLNKALDLVKKGYVKNDPYMELFDMPNQMQIEDRIEQVIKISH